MDESVKNKAKEVLNKAIPPDKQLTDTQIVNLEPIVELYTAAISEASDKEKQLERISLAEEFLKAGQTDISASFLLHQNGDYPNAVYHLQQAVEKITKAYGLAFAMINREDLYKGDKKKLIGHVTPKVFLGLFDKKIGVAAVELPKVLNLNMKTDLTDLKKLIKEKPLELANLNYEAIHTLVELNTKLRVALDTPEIRGGCKNAVEVAGTLLIEDQQIQKNIEKLKKNSYVIVELTLALMSMYLWAMVTFPHFAYTRYPNDEMPIKKYDSELGIVRALPEVLSEVKDSGLKLQNFFENRRQISSESSKQ